MKNALILHGTGNNSTGNWFLWLKEQLENIGYETFVPDLPDSDHPDSEKYWQVLKDFNFNSETILVGHSSGASVIFGILDKLSLENKVNLAISVSGFYKDEGFNCENLFKEPFNWEKIKTQANKFFVIWSSDDPYIAKDQTDFISEKLAVSPTVFQNKGHFNLEKSPDFKQFPELLEIIKNNL